MDIKLLKSDMYTAEYFKTTQVCRFCWNLSLENKDTPDKNLYNITEDLMDKIYFCLSIDITKQTAKVCCSCNNKIEEMYNFKKFCQESNKRLTAIMNNDKTKTNKTGPKSKVTSKTKKKDGVTKTVKKKKVVKSKKTQFYCNICHENFSDADVLASHNEKFHGISNDGTFKCFGCEKEFKSRRARLSHELKFCKDLNRGYKCLDCDKYLPNRRTYNTHMKAHRNSNYVVAPECTFKCSECKAIFDNKRDMKEHKALHRKQRYICETCGREFGRQDYLNKHKTTHTGVKSHVCPQCSYKTSYRSSLVIHIRKHTGERPYACDMCPQRCISISNLHAHRRRHLGIKKYQCELCSKRFGYKTSLEDHVSSAHGRPQRHPCAFCGAEFPRERELRRHMGAMHPPCEAEAVESTFR